MAADISARAMPVNSVLVISAAVLLGLVGQSAQYTYIASVQDEELFNNCTNISADTQNMPAMLDLANLNVSLDVDSVAAVSGYVVSKWNMNANSKIEASIQFIRFERSLWIPTAFAFKLPDFCREMYNPNQYWYKAVFQYVRNIDEIRDKCFNAGTVMKFRPFDIRFEIEINLGNMDGRYKMVTTFTEFPRLTPEVCFEMEFAVVRK